MPIASVVLAALLAVLWLVATPLPGVASWAIGNELQARFGPFASLSVEINAEHALDLPSGLARYVNVRAEGFNVQGVPVQEADVRTSLLHLDPGSLIFGHTAVLTAPATAHVHAALTAPGIEAALRSPLVAGSLTGLPVHLQTFPGFSIDKVDVVPQHVQLSPGRIAVQGVVQVPGTGFALPFDVSGAPTVVGGALVVQQPAGSFLGTPMPPDMLAMAMHPIPLRTVALPGGNFHLTSVQVGQQALDLAGEVDVEHLP